MSNEAKGIFLAEDFGTLAFLSDGDSKRAAALANFRLGPLVEALEEMNRVSHRYGREAHIEAHDEVIAAYRALTERK